MKKKDKKLLIASIIVVGIVVLMIVIAQNALGQSERTIGRIDAKIEAVMSDD